MSTLRIISGGQTGVDQAALEAARRIGLLTGGWMPKGWRTTDGPCSEVGRKYGLLEHESQEYPPRTEQNVIWGDATLRLARVWTSPGERLTLRMAVKHAKRSLAVDLADPLPQADVANWIIATGAKVLNVAGNSERTSPGIGAEALAYLQKVFLSYLERRW